MKKLSRELFVVKNVKYAAIDRKDWLTSCRAREKELEIWKKFEEIYINYKFDMSEHDRQALFMYHGVNTNYVDKNCETFEDFFL